MFAIAGMLLAITVRTVSPTQDRINTHIYTRTQAHAQGTKKIHQTKMTHHRMLENYLNILKSMSNKQSGANFKISLCKARKKTCAAHLSLCQR